MIKFNDECDVCRMSVFRKEEGACIDVVEVGEELGFPGMVQARVDLRQQVVYGLTIAEFQASKGRCAGITGFGLLPKCWNS